MKKANPDSPLLTQNDKKVLRKIIEHSKISDGKIANEIGISPQAVFKIRNKLESLGIIKGYSPIIDFKKIGINELALLVVCFKPSVWDVFTEETLSERIRNIPYIISAYRIANQAHVSHLILIGFRDISQKEQYLKELQTKFSDKIDVKEIYTFTTENIITQNPMGLLNEIIDKTEFSKYTMFSKDK